nr:reverse transcriptase domain-containing protein [Tanacetum cinerariifolium]
MPNNVKTYDETGDPEDHVKNFQAAAHVERWAMPTWCHMFNSTLIGAARVWFDELPPERIDSYKDLKAAFLAYFMQQKKYVKDPVEIHNIKQKDEETIEDFMKRFKVETGRMKGAPECMRISRFMHGVNNLELTKRLNENVPKTMEEMMITTTAFVRGEAVAAGKKKGKFQSPPPMVIPVEKRSSNKFCDFHNDKEHITDECMQLKKQIKELVRAGDADNSTRAWMNFMIVRSLSSYNGIIERPGIKEIQAVPSTAQGMLKFPADGGIASNITGVPRLVAEHRLNIREGYSPVRQKKRVRPRNARRPSKQRKIHTREGGDNRGRGRWTNIDDTNNIIFERKDSSRFRIKARQYELLEGVLFRRSFLTPWLRCVRPLQADYVIREIYKGSCSMHARPRSVVAKVIRLGYYWPTMHEDARDMIRACNDCQIHRPVTKNPKQPLTSITAPWTFYKWGTDKAGPFPDGPGKKEQTKAWGEGIKACLGEGNKNSIEELPHVLWAHRIIIKSSHGDTPFSLTYGMEAVIPAEIGMPTYHTATVDTVHNDEEIRLNLDLLEERRERATIREAKSKLKMTKYYNARVRGVLSGQATLSTAVTTLVMLWMEGSSVRSGKDLTRYRKH